MAWDDEAEEIIERWERSRLDALRELRDSLRAKVAKQVPLPPNYVGVNDGDT